MGSGPEEELGVAVRVRDRGEWPKSHISPGIYLLSSFFPDKTETR